MKPEIKTLPKNKCVLDFIAELGDKAKDAWIYLHISIVEELKNKADNYNWIITDGCARILRLVFNATELYPRAILEMDVGTANLLWYNTHRIEADDIKFTSQPLTPNEIIFIKY